MVRGKSIKNDQQLRPGGHGGRKEAMNKLPRKQLVLKAVLLLRTVNRYSSKETQLKMMDKYYSTEQLEDYVEHFNDPQPVYEEPDYVMDDSGSEYYTHYSPSNPWDAPGMSIHDFI